MVWGAVLSTESHRPVMCDQILQALQIKTDGFYVDATYGRGGHSQAILSKLSDQARLFVFDQDQAAYLHAQRHLEADPRVRIYHDTFTRMAHHLAEAKVEGQIDGVLLDLGVSSPQLDNACRGFSFQQEGPLDMRMDQRQTITAAAWLNQTSEEEIVRVLREYGEEKRAKTLAKHIVNRRCHQPWRTTLELAQLCQHVYGRRHHHHHPATRTFQAIRIEINQELSQLESALAQAIAVLKPGGRLAVITFHSLEDRLVKQYLKRQHQHDHWPKQLPITDDQHPQALLSWLSRPVRACETEIGINRRARSATLRIAEKSHNLTP